MEQNCVRKLTILHFNDVYNLEERKNEPVGGVARFKTALDSFAELEPLILFSGDLFHPSLLSLIYNGEQMVKPVNAFNVDVACFGNHEFSLDIETLTTLINRTNFPWLLSNVKDSSTGSSVAGGKEFHIMDKHGLRIGFLGLAEEDWLFDVVSISKDNIVFEEFIECSRRLTKLLKDEQKCDLIFALTHMRTHNDIKLAEEFQEFDLILGGHDHVNFVKEVNGTYIIKSGSDFREFNKITLTLPSWESCIPKNEKICDKKKESEHNCLITHRKCSVSVETIYVTNKFSPESNLEAHTKYYLDNFQHMMGLPLGFTLCELETRFERIRNSEQNLCNFIADIIRLGTESDCAMMSTGSIRSNLLFKPGLLTMGDLRFILPYVDLIAQFKITGEQLLKTLENSISKYPALEGRFPAISGVNFEFDPNKESMKRVIIQSIKIKGQPLDLNKIYKVAVNHWIYEGKDGYEGMTKAKAMVDESGAHELHLMIKNFFELAKDQNIRKLFKDEQHEKNEKPQENISYKNLHLYNQMKQLISNIVEENNTYYVAINPQVEGRIVCKV